MPRISKLRVLFCSTIIGSIFFSAALLAEPASRAPVRLYAAGSLTGAMKALITASGLPSGSVADPTFGPAGVLGDRLANGETADVFASADMTQPRRLAARDPAFLVVPFARNRMCVASRVALGLTESNLLDTLLRPDVRLATSTPGADPGGDYALAVFRRAEEQHPGAEAALIAKALKLVGGPTTMVPVEGHSPTASIFLADKADALLYYCSSGPALAKEVQGIVNLPLPAALEVYPLYGMAVRAEDPQAVRFALFLLSDAGQKILADFGFRPLAETP